MKKTSIFLLIILLFTASCQNRSPERRQLFMMDTVMDFQIYGEKAALAMDELARTISQFERAFSPLLPDSEANLMNQNAGKSPLSPEMQTVLERSIQLAQTTHGTFDPALHSLIRLWNIGSEHPRIPEEQEITVARSHSGYRNIKLTDHSCTLINGVGINLGGVAKGYTSDVARDILTKYDIPRAVLSVGGNIYVKGTRPDGSPWSVGVRDPDGSASDTLATIRAQDEFIIASGDYERYFEKDGTRYHHIIDPKTGAPARGDLRSVVIVCDNGTMGDAYSTALFVMGHDGALRFWREQQNFEMVLILKNHKIIITEGLRDKFTLSDRGYTYEVESR